jgi:DNA-directed RNA polymerase subunit N (RpoN/RPB10)
MNILKKVFSPPHRTGPFYIFSVKCLRCGETIQGQVDLRNEPSLVSDDTGKPFYICRKVLIGNQRCFQQIEVVLKFDDDRRLIEQNIVGGCFIESSSDS